MHNKFNNKFYIYFDISLPEDPVILPASSYSINIMSIFCYFRYNALVNIIPSSVGIHIDTTFFVISLIKKLKLGLVV